MALIDLISDLTWYGTPPAYDGAQNPQGISGTNEHQTGFTPGRKHLDETEFTGVTGASPTLSFNRPNVFSTVLGFTDNWINTDASGFTPGRKQLDPTEFTGVTGGPGALEFSRPAVPNTIIGAYDGAFNPAGPPSSNVDQTGFTLGRKRLDPTEFTGVTGTAPDLFFNRPSVFSTVLGNVDNLHNTAAKGFTPDLIHRSPSQFQGITISDWTYDYPATILSSYGFYNTTMPGKFNPGTTVVDNLHNTAALGFTPDIQYRPLNKRSLFRGISPSDWTYDYPTTGESSYGFYNDHMPGKPLGSIVNTKFSPKYVPGGNVVGFQAESSRFSFNQDTLRPFTKVPTVLGQGLDGPYKRKEAKNSFWIDNKTYNANGNASFLNQGGEGYPFPSFDGTQYDWKPNKHTGFNPNSRYGDVTANQTSNASNTNFGLADTYTTNSPIDDMYNKFVVRDEAFNPVGYAREPFILRGIQRPGKSENQRWGFGVTGPWKDDGLMRSGVVTSVDRLAMDVLRIGKWLIKPKGILWMVKQFGLQQSNPTYETTGGGPGAPIKQRHKIFTPVNLLANVATNALGIHLNRHGITPFDKNKGRYGDIFKGRSEATQNRLYQTAYGKVGMFGDNFAAVEVQQVGMPITNLFYINGPNSLYGIPGTSTLSFLGPKRATDTSLKAQFQAYQSIPSLKDIKKKLLGFDKKMDEKSWTSRWSYQDYKGVQYTHDEKYKENETPPETTGAEKEWLDDKKEGQSSQLITDVNESKPILNFGNAPVTPSKRNEIGDVQNYATVAYGKLPTKEKAITPSSFHDFRSLIDKPDNVKFMGSPEAAAYAEKNIQTKYGIPNSGKVGVDRSDFNADTGLNDKVNMIKIGEDYGPQGKKDFIKFKFKTFAGPIIFRAYISSFNDSLSPSWAEVSAPTDKWGKWGIGTISRELQISFIVAASSRQELIQLWEKTDQLGQLGYPIGEDHTEGQSGRLTIGNLIKNEEITISNFSINFDNETLWDVDAELPMHWEVDIGMKMYPKRKYNSIKTNTYYSGIADAYPTIDGKKVGYDHYYAKKEKNQPEGVSQATAEPKQTQAEKDAARL